MVNSKYARPIALAAIVAASLANAGHANAQTMQAGLVSGFNINTVVGADSGALDSRTTPIIGAQLVFKPTRMVGFETGLRLVSKGATGEFADVVAVAFK